VRCIVTAGPTFEPLDQVRRLTNFSTGRLGTQLAQFLVSRGAEVLLLRGEASTFTETIIGAQIEQFDTTINLAKKLEQLAGDHVQAVFHAAAVSDFRFGCVLKRTSGGSMQEVNSGKVPTRELANAADSSSAYFIELLPTPKIISRLREWFPAACIVGWKYEVDGTKADAVKLGCEQIAVNRTDACVVNGPAYGAGFALVRASGEIIDLPSAPELFEQLVHLVDLPSD